MSQWEYEAGRRVCLENMIKGDFSNHLCGIDPKTPKEKQEYIEWAKKEVEEVTND